MKSGLIFLILLLASSACAYPLGWHMMDWGGYGGFMTLIVLLVLIGLAVFFLVERKKLRQNYDDEDALAILKKRYAKGEITKKEFEEMKKDLNLD